MSIIDTQLSVIEIQGGHGVSGHGTEILPRPTIVPDTRLYIYDLANDKYTCT